MFKRMLYKNLIHFETGSLQEFIVFYCISHEGGYTEHVLKKILKMQYSKTVGLT